MKVARTSRRKALGVWMNGLRVGEWAVAPGGEDEFRYAESWLEHPDSRPISLSLPFAGAGYAYRGSLVSAYFENLLPDSSEIRRRIRVRYGAASSSTFDLLSEIGRDCVGAVQLLGADEEPAGLRRIEGRPIGESEIASVLNGLTAVGAGSELSSDEFRISLAGAQEKTALLYRDGRWMVPHGSTPTTHIVKLPLGRIGGLSLDMSRSVENEWFCLKIAAAMGFKTANCEIVRFEDVEALVVERFDRRFSSDGSWIMRLPQEDFCQATGTHPDRKYESDGGPGIETIMRILLGSQAAQEDREGFFATQILFWLLAAPDGHAKNFSIFIEREGRFRLAPLYDIISVYPALGHGEGRMPQEKLKLAMAFSGKNRHYKWSEIGARHIRETARRNGLEASIDGILERIASAAPRAVEEVLGRLPRGFPEEIAHSIATGVVKRAEKLV